jgi:cytochrome c oxidase subunit 1
VVPTVLGNFCLPLMIGAKDLAFPRINLASWYLFVIGGAWALYGMLAGGIDTGWTFYTPYTSQATHYDVVPTLVGIVITGFSSILTGLNFIVTTHRLRAPGLTWWRLPLFVWTLVAGPSAIKVFNWTATLYKGSISLEAPMLFSLGFVCLFTAGGLTGLFLATLGMDMHVHDTYFIIGHFHFIMVGGMVLAYMSGLHYWWPKMTGRMYSEWWSKLAAIIIFVGFFLTFLPHFVLGYSGMPRRYHRYPPEFQVWNVMSSAGASILAVGYVLPLIYLLLSLKYGKPAGPNPWKATGLEWQTPSPPPPHNFEETPVVVRAPYEYHVEKAQNEP